MTFGQPLTALTQPPASCPAAPLTSLQLVVSLDQAPVHAAVAVRLLQQHLQHISDRLALVHPQGLGAAVAHQHLDYDLRGGGGGGGSMQKTP